MESEKGHSEDHAQRRRVEQLRLGRVIFSKMFGENRERLSVKTDGDSIHVFDSQGELLGTYDRDYIFKPIPPIKGISIPSPTPYTFGEIWVRGQVENLEKKRKR
jgi:hypothetical protein